MKKIIKLFDPVTGKDEEKIIKQVIKSKFWASGSGQGFVKKFENEFKNYIGSSSCIAVNSGTAALHLALSLFDIKDKQVIVPSLSFVSTANAVLYNGAKPIFVDVNQTDLCIDISHLKKLINKKTKVILPVHFGGMPANLDEIKSLCEKNNLIMIEDAAHACGSSYKNNRIGTHGDAICFSFHPVKNLAMPNGGAITLNCENNEFYESKLKSLRWCGISDRKNFQYDVKTLGWNYYLNEFSASIGLIQLKKINKLNSIRQKIAKKYFNELNVDLKMPYSNNCSYHFYWILVKDREKFMKKMLENGIETGIHYKPIHKMTLYKNSTSLITTEKISKKLVSLPTHPNLSTSDIEKIIKNVNKFS